MNGLPRIYMIITCMLLLVTTSLMAQTRHPILDRLDVFEVNGSIHIDCIISAGYTCNGISYYRAVKGEDFEKIGEVTGICGSPDFPVRYQYIDENPPKNVPLTYMIDFGGFGNTEEIQIEIVDTDALGYQVRPNPTAGFTQIFFKNSSNTEHEISIMDSSGKIVYSATSIDKFFEIDLLNNPPGIYLFLIQEIRSGDIIRGKIILQ